MTQSRYIVETYPTGHSVVWDNLNQIAVETEYFRGPKSLDCICQSLNREWERLRVVTLVFTGKDPAK